MMEPKRSVASSALSAAKWGYVGTIARVAIQVVAQLILARLLGPELLGVYAVGAIVLGLAAFIVDMGIGPALVQKDIITPEDVRFAFTVQLLIGMLLFVTIMLLAPLIAEAMHQPAATDVVRALSFVCLLNAVSAVAQNLLRRQLNFREIHIGQVISFAVSYFLIGIPLAVLGYGVWALVGAVIIQNLIASVWMLARSPHPRRPLLFHPQGGKELLSFGLRAFGTNILNWLLANIDRLFVGRFFPGHGLGVYNTTYNLILAPVGQILGIFQSILFPVSSQVQIDREKLRELSRGALNLGALFVIPAFTAVSMLAVPLINLLYGSRWSDAAPVLAAISAAMIPYCLMGILTPILWGVGKVELEARVQFFCAILLIVLCFFASQISYIAVAWVVMFVFGCRFLAIVSVFSAEFAMPFLSLIGEIRSGLIVGMAGVGLINAIATAVNLSIFPSIVELTIGIALYCIVGILAFFMLSHLISPNGARLFLKIFENSQHLAIISLKERLAARGSKVS